MRHFTMRPTGPVRDCFKLAGHLFSKNKLIRFFPVLLALLFLGTRTLAPFASSKLRVGAGRLSTLPKVMLWAWERPVDLRHIDTRTTGVAYLAKTIYVFGDTVRERPRMQPLKIPDDTALVAVIRIESDPNHPAALSPEQRHAVLESILQVANRNSLRAIQIDYDARLSERKFYRELIKDLHEHLPSNLPLSMTALASWCLDDNWISDLPVEEVVPMMFEMGPAKLSVNEYLRSGGDFRSGVCGQSVGLATYEKSAVKTAGKRIYWFSK
jgi:hypothetical protein